MSVLREELIFWAPLVLVPFRLPRYLEGCVACREFLEKILVLLLCVHGLG